MALIKKLPPHLINRLKAGEIVERPASVVKELIENSLDAGATSITLEIEKGGKQRISIKDNGTGIASEDLPLAIERYATSKILTEKDLQDIHSYGFRGEALATISEVSGFRIQTKQQQDSVGHELRRDGKQFTTKEIPFAGDQGTIVHITDIFHAIPAREKFLKTDATERGYIKKLVINYAIMHRDKQRSLEHNGKNILSLAPASSLLERVIALTKDERQPKLKSLEVQDDQLHIYGLAGDASLHFPKGDWLHLFVNGRPVEDRLLKRAVMDAYARQIVPGTYPFALVFVEIDPQLVDVNVHPRKQQVKFLDPGSIFNRVKYVVQEAIGNQQVNYAAFSQTPVRESYRRGGYQQPSGLTGSQMDGLQSLQENSAAYGQGYQQGLDLQHNSLIAGTSLGEQTRQLIVDQEPVRIVGQLRDSYILLQGEHHVYWVDQHALAERITFEKMRKEVKENGFETELLLQPLTLSYPAVVDIEPLLEKLNTIGFDVSMFGEKKVIIHAVPKVFSLYTIDIELVMQFVRGEGMSVVDGIKNNGFFDLILDEILGMKACKASIKAGQKLSMLEMEQLIQDGVDHIDGMFVCQHGRPSVVGTHKHDIDELFDR